MDYYEIIPERKVCYQMSMIGRKKTSLINLKGNSRICSEIEYRTLKLIGQYLYSLLLIAIQFIYIYFIKNKYHLNIKD